ncbi:MAG: sodium:calcium antiporter, partial [Actinomycetota bacterium]|nr:sodium:calcium antiporter [Actinomycetota bacterium]
MPSLLGLLLLVVGVVLVVAGAELFFEGLLASAPRFGVSPFALTVLVSGFEIENIAAGIAANLSGLPNAAAGTFLGGTTFLALAVTGTAVLFAPVRVEVPRGVAVWTALAPLPLLTVAVDGTISRLDGAILLA